jgi:cellulose 1,4-beta-cellobiosidase
MPLRSCRVEHVAALLTVATCFAACAADPGDDAKGDAGAATGDGSPYEIGSSSGDAISGDDVVLPSYDAATYDVVSADVTNNDGGATETSVPDAPPEVAVCDTCPLVVEYMTPTTSAMSQEIKPHLDIYNNGTSPQDLSVLTVRYWYTADGSQSQAYNCDYTALTAGCPSVNATFTAMATPTSTADHYMEVSFTSGSIDAGGHTGEIQTRFHDTNYAVTFTQTNDWSFDMTEASYVQWQNVTLYRSGKLVWGTEPK